MNDPEQSKSNKSWRTGFLPVIALFFLAPLSAEYIIYLNAMGNLVLILTGLIIMAPLYGGTGSNYSGSNKADRPRGGQQSLSLPLLLVFYKQDYKQD